MEETQKPIVVVGRWEYETQPEHYSSSCDGCAFRSYDKGCDSANEQYDCTENKVIFKPKSQVEEVPLNPIVSAFNERAKSIHVDSSNIPVVNIPNQEIRVTNEKGGTKADGLKPRPTLLLRSMPDAVQSVIRILEYGAKKYDDNNWKKVESHRYDDAALRHILAYLSGEELDKETSESHLSHAITCLLFRLQLDIDSKEKA
jgi:hypothetical protein